MEITCPNCGVSHYSVRYTSTTAMGWIQTYKDGVPQNDNPNISTTFCTCCNCKHNFHYQVQYGKVIDIVDDGKLPEVPVIELDDLTQTTDTDIEYEKLVVKPSECKNEIEIPIQLQVDKILKELEEVKEEIKELKGLLGYV